MKNLEETPSLDIIYSDQDIIAINKPSGLLVHRSMIDRHETRFALQLLRDQIGQRVYPVHRLDKPTSGVLLFALSSNVARILNEQFAATTIEKTYLAVVRGYAPDYIEVDHRLTHIHDPLTDGKTKTIKPAQSAVTTIKKLAEIELPFCIDRYPKSRYSLVECRPKTGRKHQIRRHLKHIGHPIIGDAKHGKGRHNRYFKEHLNAGRLLLAATEMKIMHPTTHEPLILTAPLDTILKQLLINFQWQHTINSQLMV